jgi:hypothetical protein
MLSALASRIPYEHRVSIHNLTPEAVERLPCQAGVLFVTLINNSSECINRSHSDLMLNNRSARRRFGRPPPWQIWSEFTYSGLVNRRSDALEASSETLLFLDIASNPSVFTRRDCQCHVGELGPGRHGKTLRHHSTVRCSTLYFARGAGSAIN